MNRIIKYPLVEEGASDDRVENCTLNVPYHNKVRYLHAGYDSLGKLCVWVMLDLLHPSHQPVDEHDHAHLRIAVRGDGDSCDDVAFWPHISTINGLHVFGEPI